MKVPPESRIERPVAREPSVFVSVSVPQEKRPVSDQRSFEVAALSQSTRVAPKYADAEAYPDASKIPEIDAFDNEVNPVTFRVPPMVVFPPMDAMVPTSITLVNCVDAALKVHMPDTVSSCDREAGPPGPQFKRISDSDAVVERENIPASKEREPTWVNADV